MPLKDLTLILHRVPRHSGRDHGPHERDRSIWRPHRRHVTASMRAKTPLPAWLPCPCCPA